MPRRTCDRWLICSGRFQVYFRHHMPFPCKTNCNAMRQRLLGSPLTLTAASSSLHAVNNIYIYIYIYGLISIYLFLYNGIDNGMESLWDKVSPRVVSVVSPCAADWLELVPCWFFSLDNGTMDHWTVILDHMYGITHLIPYLLLGSLYTDI